MSLAGHVTDIDVAHRLKRSRGLSHLIGARGGGVYEGEGIGKVGWGCGGGRERKGIFRRERFVIVGEVWDSYLCF